MNAKQTKILSFALANGFTHGRNSNDKQPQLEKQLSPHVKVRLNFWIGESTSLVYFDKVVQPDAQWAASFDHDAPPEIAIAAINTLL